METNARYRILGPVEVRQGDAWVSIAPAKWRALLAVLLINAGSVVPTDELERQLWPQSSPAAARRLVQHYVCRLRRLLGDEQDRRVLRTRPTGYQLLVGPGELDADQFTACAAEGHRALAGGRYAEAAERLRAALSAWRAATALADVTGVPSVEVAAAGLDERRLTATEGWLRASLASGPVEAVIPELQALVVAHPLRERMRELLMVALYRAGRRCDALATGRDLRMVLREEHGLDPDDAVQRVERMILRGESFEVALGTTGRVG
ncbi:winged helix-turn-helix domain-containing protein [Micromonospora sp. NIE79]|uniref:Winged helix-turn-helix domain-containing protein n=1 Tax=Micromonospora trifolii TaxID=2911208 RepID=A0ABS9N285_9ACTN|nr:BTAD domain-containing putative transcriptional regulator [Micromonospora trifolii]MCG5444050.1 winged helix-turn-helix domain-containing protein [Micromonospora trifolii]